jgi:hypothetical protein
VTLNGLNFRQIRSRKIQESRASVLRPKIEVQAIIETKRVEITYVAKQRSL